MSDDAIYFRENREKSIFSTHKGYVRDGNNLSRDDRRQILYGCYNEFHGQSRAGAFYCRVSSIFIQVYFAFVNVHIFAPIEQKNTDANHPAKIEIVDRDGTVVSTYQGDDLNGFFSTDRTTMLIDLNGLRYTVSLQDGESFRITPREVPSDVPAEK